MLKKLFKNYKKVIAFSLIEVLISITVIAIVTAVFMPITTKKMKTSKVNLNTTCISDKCSKIDEDCKVCTCTDTCIICNKVDPDINSGNFLDLVSCKYKQCSDVFDNCEKCTRNECTKCGNGTNLKDGKCES